MNNLTLQAKIPKEKSRTKRQLIAPTPRLLAGMASPIAHAPMLGGYAPMALARPVMPMVHPVGAGYGSPAAVMPQIVPIASAVGHPDGEFINHTHRGS